MGQLTDLAGVAEYLGIVSQGRRPGNRVWELIRAGKLKGLPYLRIGRRYRFNMAEVEAWVKRQMTANGSNGMLRLR
jgi:excisionase family DNA binding protein